MASEVGRFTALKMALLAVSVSLVSAGSLLAEEAPLFSYRKPQAVDSRILAKNALQPAEIPTDLAFQQAAHTAETQDPAQKNDSRRLGRRARSSAVEVQSQAVSASGRVAASTFPKLESFTSAGAGLAIVIGLFLLCMWLLRRSGPRPTSALPPEAVAVLGRVPLAARHFAHLIQVGKKLVLVSVTPEGVSPITEVSDPLEVERLLGLCMHNKPQSSTAQFQQVLQQLAQEPAQGFLGAEGQTAANKQ